MKSRKEGSTGMLEEGGLSCVFLLGAEQDHAAFVMKRTRRAERARESAGTWADREGSEETLQHNVLSNKRRGARMGTRTGESSA